MKRTLLSLTITLLGSTAFAQTVNFVLPIGTERIRLSAASFIAPPIVATNSPDN